MQLLIVWSFLNKNILRWFFYSYKFCCCLAQDDKHNIEWGDVWHAMFDCLVTKPSFCVVLSIQSVQVHKNAYEYRWNAFLGTCFLIQSVSLYVYKSFNNSPFLGLYFSSHSCTISLISLERCDFVWKCLWDR